MARRCARCKRVLRFDESLSTCHEPGVGIFSACPHCCAQVNGWPAPPERVYPKGEPVPTWRTDGDLPICGLCRRALFEDDRVPARPMRLRREDAADLPEFDWVEDSDCFASCRECIAFWRPRIAARLRREGVIGEGVPDRAVGGNLLM